MHPNHDDLIKVSVENAAPHEADAFKKYFRYYINDVMDDNYVGEPIATRTAKFTMKITVADRAQTTSGKTGGTQNQTAIMDYTYRIRVELIRDKDNLQMWSWHPARIEGYPDYIKTIKRLSRYAAIEFKKKGLLDTKHLAP
jgi:hypothetical protein